MQIDPTTLMSLADKQHRKDELRLKRAIKADKYVSKYIKILTEIEWLTKMKKFTKYNENAHTFIIRHKYSDVKHDQTRDNIVRFSRQLGYEAQVYECRGTRHDDRAIVTDVVGFQREIGSAHYRRSVVEKGHSDTFHKIPNKSGGFDNIYCEIKKVATKDRLREDQISFREKTIRQGDIYMIIGSFDEWFVFVCDRLGIEPDKFLEWWKMKY